MKKLLILFTLFASCGHKDTPQKNTVDSTITTHQISTNEDETNTEKLVLFLNDTVLHYPGFTLAIRAIDSVAIQPLYKDHQTRTVVRDSDHSFRSGERAIEHHLAGIEGQYFRRDGDTLHLLLDDGNRHPVWDKGEDDEDPSGIDYSYEHLFPSLNAYLLYAQWYEGNDFLLVGKSTGKETDLIGRPAISPAGKKIMAYQDDWDARYSTNGLQFLERSADTFRTTGFLDGENWAPLEAQWLSEDKLVLKVRQIVSKDRLEFKPAYFELTINRR